MISYDKVKPIGSDKFLLTF